MRTIRPIPAALIPALLLAGCVLDRPADTGLRGEVVVIPAPPKVEAPPAPALAETAPPAQEAEAAPPPSPPPPPPDLWSELRTAFALPASDHRRVGNHLRWLKRHPDYLDRVFRRGEPYMGWILEEVRQRGLPAELVLLPVVESGYNPFAYSHGRAAGLWQFIPATGKRFGIRQNWWYDGRRDLVDSTRAALDYLEYLNRRFKGDWLLALAAYNSGEGNVHKALRRNRKRGKPTDFWSLKLPAETREYVPRLIALKRIVADPAAYGLSLPDIEAGNRLALVETGGQIDLALAAELAGLPLEDVYRLNAGFNRWATDPAGPHRLVLPRDRAQAFADALAALPPEQRVRWARHRVRPGETLSHIARRYETTVALLSRVNGVRPTRLRAGDYLLIPVARRELADYSLSAAQRQAALHDRKRSGIKVVHRVRAGDTLWDLARQYGVGVRSLAKWNGMAPGDTLREGQKLVIWTRPAAGSASALPGGSLRKISYRVRKGDSLARISRKFRVSVEDLKRWNGLDGRKYLQPGQRLTLYVDITRQSS
ncbi:MAG TPA: LysM peptidoglycan-binding domain-containing protein [Thiotrichales bacterium]|nr:LysM peptidoglycan-binding domain-containing protein [Thiotrichales bacterium]